MSRVGWSLNLPPTLDHLPRSFAILPSYAVPVRRHMPGWWRGHPGRSCFLVRPSRDRRSSRAHVRTNAARARTCRGGVVSASIRRIQFLKGNHRRPLWGHQPKPLRAPPGSALGRLQRFSRCPANGGYRRSAADGGRCREGPLTDPIADAQAGLWELVKMPPKRPSDRAIASSARGAGRKQRHRRLFVAMYQAATPLDIGHDNRRKGLWSSSASVKDLACFFACANRTPSKELCFRKFYLPFRQLGVLRAAGVHVHP